MSIFLHQARINGGVYLGPTTPPSATGSITDAQYAEWLLDPNKIPVTVFETYAYRNGTLIYRGFSTAPYTNGDPAKPYTNRVISGSLVPETLDVAGGDATMGTGKVDLDNTDGSLDAWLFDVWQNQPITAWVGDVRWARADFRPLSRAFISSFKPNGRDKLTIEMRNEMQRLNSAMSEVKLGGNSTDADKLIPLAFGDNFNVTPLCIDPNILKYQVHNGPVERICDIRDNGVPVPAAIDLATGTFILLSKPYGTVTCDVQGDKYLGVYANTIGSIVRRIVTGFGKLSDRFNAGDLDLANLAAFEAQHPQVVGLYLTERTNVIVACNQLSASVGAQVLPNRAGLLSIVQLTFPLSATAVVKQSAQVDHTITATAMSDPVAAVTLAYCVNYTPQDTVSDKVPVAHKQLYKDQWLTKTSTDETVRNAYKLSTDPATQRETCLMVGTDAQAEADRELLMYKVPRITYRFEGEAPLTNYAIGSAVKVYSNRYQLDTGKVGVFTSITINPCNLHVTAEVTI